MIGANASPMSMFTGDGGQAFQRGMIIGNANSPFSSVAEALKNTLDKYNSHLSAQQDQQDKMDLIKQQYGLQGDNLIKGIQTKYQQSAPQLSPEQSQIDPMHPEDPKFMRDVAGVKMYPQPVYDTYGRVKGYKYVNPRALSMMDMLNSNDAANPSSGADAEASQTLSDLQQLQSQLPQGI